MLNEKKIVMLNWNHPALVSSTRGCHPVGKPPRALVEASPREEAARSPCGAVRSRGLLITNSLQICLSFQNMYFKCCPVHFTTRFFVS